MNPDDIPTSITELTYTAPKIRTETRDVALSQNQAAALLAHFWPAIEAHIREQVAQQVAAIPTANDGQLFYATREQVLKAIRNATP